MSRRLTRFLLLCLALAALWWVVASNRDWFFFHLHRDTVVRDAGKLALSLQGTGLDVQELGRVRYGDQSLPLWALRLPSTAPKASTVCLLAGVHIEADSQLPHARTGERGLVSIGEAEFDSVGKTTAALWARRNGSGHAFIVETFDAMPLEQRVSVHLMAIERLTRLLLPR